VGTELPARIVLVRHGPSAHTVRGRHSRDDILRWRDDYDRAGIQSHSEPPVSLRRIVADADVVVTSSMRRALESGQRLAIDRPIATSALLAELPLHVPRVGGRFPLGVWGAFIHANWLLGMARGNALSPSHRRQVEDAAMWLMRQAPAATVLAVTHGVMRRELSRHLVTTGWTRTRTERGYQPWSAWFFEPAPG
jgi:broad specificity phosphatase PhoE